MTQENAQQAPAQSVNIRTHAIAEVVLSDGRFATIFKPKTGHLLQSKASDDTMWMANLMIQVVHIEGKPATIEDVLNLDMSEFSMISEHIGKNLQ